jgi:hypothetical protein
MPASFHLRDCAPKFPFAPELRNSGSCLDTSGARWGSPERHYVLSDGDGIIRLNKLVDAARLHLVLESGGKTLYSNVP